MSTSSGLLWVCSLLQSEGLGGVSGSMQLRMASTSLIWVSPSFCDGCSFPTQAKEIQGCYHSFKKSSCKIKVLFVYNCGCVLLSICSRLIFVNRYICNLGLFKSTLFLDLFPRQLWH